MVQLLYWPNLPGRGEFVRWVLAEAGVDWKEPAREQGTAQPVLDGLCRAGEMPHFAVPLLEIDGLRISQTAAIAHHVAATHDLAGDSVEHGVHALQLCLTVMDLVAEAHDTHHPVSTALFYEDQLSEARHAAAVFRAQRLPKFLDRFQAVLTHSGSGWLVGTRHTVADLFLALVLDGLDYAFPVAMERQLSDRSELRDHRATVHALPRIAAYRASPRCMPFNQNGIFRRYPALDESR